MHLIIVLHPEQDLIFHIMLFLLENKFLSSIKGHYMHKIRLTRKRVEIKKHSYVVTHKTHTFNSAAYTFLWCSLKETSCSCHFISLQSKVVVFFFYSNLH